MEKGGQLLISPKLSAMLLRPFTLTARSALITARHHHCRSLPQTWDKFLFSRYKIPCIIFQNGNGCSSSSNHWQKTFLSRSFLSERPSPVGHSGKIHLNVAFYSTMLFLSQSDNEWAWWCCSICRAAVCVMEMEFKECPEESHHARSRATSRARSHWETMLNLS